MAVLTTLNFFGRTEKALTLYREALGAETLFLMRFRDCPDESFMHPGMEEMIFHATFRIDGTEFMASDVGYSKETAMPAFAGFALALSPESIERARAIFAALSVGGQVVIPLAESSFTGWYGIVVDSLGVSWKINVSKSGG
jgi:PhnB protein